MGSRKMFTNQISELLRKKPKNTYDLSTSGKFIFVRHGETDYNVKIQEIKKEIAGIDPNHLDMPLNKKGISQSNELSKSLKDFKIKIVLTSPLRRTLETTYNSLKNHPDKDKIKILICPLVTETVTATHDYSLNIHKKKEYFSKKNLGMDFDWSLFEEKFPSLGDQEFYYLRFIDNVDPNKRNNEILQKLLKMIDEVNKISGENKEFYELYVHDAMDKIQMNLGDLANYYYQIIKKKPESLNHMFIRSLKFKEFLRNLNENLGRISKERIQSLDTNADNSTDTCENDEEKVLVFTHSAFIKISSSVKAYELENIDTYPEDCAIIKNCEMISIEIN